MTNKLSTKRIFYITFFAVLISIVAELLFIINPSEALTIYHSKNLSQKIYTSNEISLYGCEISDNIVTTQTNDPQILIKNINTYVGILEINISTPSTSVIPVQIFWETTEHGYLEENSIHTTIQENKTTIFIPVNQNVTSLRIDIGTDVNLTYELEQIILNPNMSYFVIGNIFNMSIIRIIFYFLGIIVFIVASQDLKTFSDFLFKYRWGIGVCFIALCTLFKLHGSSIGEISYLLSGTDTSRIWGTSRAIRSDEYVVFTEMALSQVRSGFQWFSDIWGYSSSDMFMVYGQPILNLTTLYRPFSVGYILLGAEYGLAFYWSSRFIICLLTSFEFGRIITNDNRILSTAYSLLVSLAPIVQWWYSINELVEIIIFGQLALIIIHYYFKTTSTRKKCIMVFGFVLCTGGYILTLYPAWMIPFVYVFAGCAMAIIIDNKELIHIAKKDILLWFCGIFLLASSMLYVLSVSSDTMAAVMNTAYPGNRIYVGGPIDNFIELFRGWTSYLWTFISIGNPCDEVCFISFFPLGFILSLVLIFKHKVKDIWLILLNIINLLLILYFIVELPYSISVISLMKYTSQRMVNAIGFLNLIILFRATIYISNISKYLTFFIPLELIVLPLFFYGCDAFLSPSLKVIVTIFLILSTYVIFNLNKKSYQKYFLVLCILISIIGGGLVNPIESGLNTVYNNNIIQKIEEINNNESGLWAVISNDFRFSNLPTVVGAHTLNAVSTYPDTELWCALALEDSEEIWNRYAHITIEIDEQTFLECIFSDSIRLHITPEKLKELGVDYIFTTNEFNGSSFATELYSYNQFSIWKMK